MINIGSIENKYLGTFRLLRAVIIFTICLSLPFIFYASASFSSDSNPKLKDIKKERKKGHEIHESLKDSSNRVLETIEKGEDITNPLEDVISNIEALENEDREIQNTLQNIEEKIKSIGSSKAILRHQQALIVYMEKAAELKKHTEEVRKAKRDRSSLNIIKDKVKDLNEVIKRHQPKKDFHLKDVENRLPWRVVEPGEAILLGASPPAPLTGAPLVSTGPPSANDLSTTLDVQITPEIQQLANSLGNHPLRIFRYVYNNYDYTPYYGSMKGSLDTYYEKQGNDYDLASLLIALLRASNIPARYVRANILVPIERAQRWTGMNDPMATLQYLSTTKIPFGYYTQGGRVSHVQLEHVYVEAYIPYSNYRGTMEDDTGKLWIPLDPSFKEYRVIQKGVDLAAEMGIDWKTFSNEYLNEIRSATPIEYYKEKIDNYIAQRYPGNSIDALKRKTEISNMQFDFLPNTLPFAVLQIIGNFPEIPQELRHNIRFTIPNILDYSTTLPEVSGRRITLSFEGATSEDQAVIDQYGNIFKTPPYLIDVKPVLRINGNRVAEGAAMNAGIRASFNASYSKPVGESEIFDHSIITGSFNAVGITTGKVRPEFLSISLVEESEEVYMSKMLHSLAMKYHNQLNMARQILKDTMKIQSEAFISEAMVSTHQDRRVILGDIPISFELSGFTIDAKEMSSAVIPVDGYNRKKVIDYSMLHGHEASYQENRVFEDSMYWVSGLSAVKGLQILKAMEIKITELEPYQIYSNPNLPDVVITDINNALNMGWRVIVPEETGGLPAIPYIKYDANTGSAGYMIATMAGGYSWEITPTGYEADLTFMKDILMEKNIKITYEVLDPPSPYLVAMGNYFLLVMKVVVEDVGGYGVRVIERNMIRIDTDFRNYKWGMWPLYAFFPGEYKIKFDGKELFVFKVWGVKITVEPSTITPGTENEPNTANVKAEIVPSDITIPDMKIKLKGDLELKSGGHSHESETNKRPVPRIKNSSDEWVQEYEFTVNNDKIETTFKPSMGANNTKRGIAGKYKIVAIYDGKEIAEKEVDVKYSLIQLTSGANYCLRSVDSNHNNGEYHYGTTDANQAIGEAAAKFIEDYGKDYTPQRKIVVNDQSLILGGLFDIDGDWDEPHQTHRDGRNVDIPYKYCDGGEVSVAVNSDEWKVLKSALALKFGETNILQEDDFNHFHCTK